MASSSGVIDLCDSDDEAPAAAAAQTAAAPTVAEQAKRPRTTIHRLDLHGGVLDDSILARVEAIAQQSNCVGCDGRGLAEGVAKKFSYGCSYKDRRRMAPQFKFAVPEDRGKPGTIDVRRPPGGVGVTVINMMRSTGTVVFE